MALGKGIPVINGFDLNSKLPLDSRAVVDTMEDMNKLITDGSVGDGQLCYCKADKKLYVLKDGVWSEVGGGGGDTNIPTDLIASANKLSLGVGNAPLGNGVNLDGFTYDEATKTLKASGGEGGISVIELTDKNGTIASTQLGEINANPQNFAFKYNGKILLFTSSDSTTYKYCNNTTTSSDNNVMTTSTLLTITLSTGVYTIAENVHNVVANSIHPANGGDLTNIQVGSKVYSIPSGGKSIMTERCRTNNNIEIPAGTYRAGQMLLIYSKSLYTINKGETFLIVPQLYSHNLNEISVLLTYRESYVEDKYDRFDIRYVAAFLTDITLSEPVKITISADRYYIPVE